MYFSPFLQEGNKRLESEARERDINNETYQEVPITQPLTKAEKPCLPPLGINISARTLSFGGEQMGKTIITTEAIHFRIFLSLRVAFHITVSTCHHYRTYKCCCIIFQYDENNLLTIWQGKYLVLYVTCIRKI